MHTEGSISGRRGERLEWGEKSMWPVQDPMISPPGAFWDSHISLLALDNFPGHNQAGTALSFATKLFNWSQWWSWFLYDEELLLCHFRLHLANIMKLSCFVIISAANTFRIKWITSCSYFSTNANFLFLVGWMLSRISYFFFILQLRKKQVISTSLVEIF